MTDFAGGVLAALGVTLIMMLPLFEWWRNHR